MSAAMPHSPIVAGSIKLVYFPLLPSDEVDKYVYRYVYLYECSLTIGHTVPVQRVIV